MSWCSIWLLDSFFFSQVPPDQVNKMNQSVDVRHPFDIVHVTGCIHVKVRFWYNYYFLLYWGNDQGQGSDFFLIGLSVRLTLIGILKGDIEFVIQDIQTFCPNRSNWNRKVYFGSVQRSFVAYIKRTCGQIISKLAYFVRIALFSRGKIQNKINNNFTIGNYHTIWSDSI